MAKQCCDSMCQECCEDLGTGQESCQPLKGYNDRKIYELIRLQSFMDFCKPDNIKQFLSVLIERLWCLFSNIIANICAIWDEIAKIWEAIRDLQDRVEKLENAVGDLEDALQKILDNLYASGAITTNDRSSYEFNPNRSIASGNINLFGGTADGDSFIRTNNGETENDVTAGI